jgi:hypothetical protein
MSDTPALPALPSPSFEAEFDPIIVKIPLDDAYLRYLLAFRGERPKLDYKVAYDDSEKGDQVEIIKDIVAIANTEGGFIVLGANDDGTAVGLVVNQANAVDDSKISTRLQNYLGVLTPIHVSSHEIDGTRLAVISVSKASDVPLVFAKSGQYGTPTREVFRAGDVFVRHSSRSERWNQEDVRRMTERMVERRREEWLRTVLPDLHMAFGITAELFGKQNASAAPPTPQAVLLQDADHFADAVKDILRRNQ